MKVLLTKASEDWEEKTSTKIIEITDILELKKIYPRFILNFKKYKCDIEEFGNYDFEAKIYDDYIE